MSNNGKTLILFPKDVTTDFLEEIIAYQYKVVHSSLFSVIRIEHSDDSHQYSLEQIQQPVYTTILFLGHGSSTSLHGARNEGYRNEKFITSNNIGVFNKKRIVLVSCDSNVFIKKGKFQGFDDAIGFGDLPTDWNDIQAAREIDVNAYIGFSELIIESFRNCLVEVVKYSLADFLNEQLSLKQFYNLIRLRLNKRIARFFINTRKLNVPLSDSLLRMKNESLYVKGIDS